MARLEEYRRKRKFNETPEPKGAARARRGNRFVVQEHHARRLHYDFRLEIDGVLKSWAVPKGPSMNPADKRLAVQTEDHPLEYATFHGTIPAGHYGAGEVKIWDEGYFQPEGELSASDQLKRGELKFVLNGQKLRGSFVLVRLRNRDSSKPEWLLIKHRDAQSRPSTAPQVNIAPAQSKVGPERPAANAEVRTHTAPRGKSRVKMPAGARSTAMPRYIRPALAELTAKPFSGAEWLFEIKWDGVRTLTAIRDGKVQMWSRSERDITREYPELIDLANNVDAREAWLDGEIVALDSEGRSDFQKLQLRFGVQRPSPKLIEQVPTVYYVFDLLYLDGYDLRTVPLEKRKELLRQILRDDARIRYSDHVVADGEGLFKAAMQRSLEGIVAKKIASAYVSGRSSNWQKIKLEKDLDAVVGGWTDPRGAREYFGALLLGLYEGEKLEFIGGVGSGFAVGVQEHLWPKLQNLRVSECPFAEEPSTREQAYWVKPELVARVRFGNWTADRHLRQPRFLGLQEDRDAQSCTFEEQAAPIAKTSASDGAESSGRSPAKLKRASGRRKAHTAAGVLKAKQPSGDSTAAPSTEKQIERELTAGTSDNIYVELDGRRLHFTNLNKIYFPKDGYRKRDLLAHYVWAAPMIVPFLKDRPLVLRRYPNGIEEKAFFQKDAARETPDWIKTVSIASDSAQRSVNYIIANDRPTLLYLTNLGCIDHNPWSSRYDDQEHPDYIFFDLDPSEGTTFEIVIKFGKLLLETLESFAIKAFAKTSGATGFHIFVPVEPRYTFEQARLFVQAIGEVVARKSPGVLTFERAVNKRRRGSIYLDAHQNARGQSLACAYSVRAFEHAPVSTPVRIDDLRGGLTPDQWNLKTIRARVEKMGDLWADFWKSRQRLESLFKHAS